MNKLFVLIGLLFISFCTTAQNNNSAKYGSIVNAAGLKKHLSIIAADDMQGRETGKEGQRKAAAYIEAQFKNIGLNPPASLKSYQQLFPLLQDSIAAASLSINGKTIADNDFYFPLNSNTTGSFAATQLIFVGYGIEDARYNDYKQTDVKGKVVVFFMGEPKINGNYFISANGRSSEWTYIGIPQKIALAKAKGAAGVLIIKLSEDTLKKKFVSTKSALYYPSDEIELQSIPNVIISSDLAKIILKEYFEDWLKAAQNKSLFDKEPMSLNEKIAGHVTKITTTLFASNILGVIEGTDKKDEYVFLTAHYDHLGMKDGKVYNGADDDGSGTAAVIQMATAFSKAKKDGNGPRRTMVFMTVSGEEKGLWGSEYYSDHPIYPLDKTTVDLNTDMIGRIDTERKKADTLNYVYVVGHDKISSELPVINQNANSNTVDLVLDYKFDDPNDPNKIYYRSDHYNFARKGVPVLFFYDGMLQSDYHQITDDIEKIYWPLYEKRAQMIFYTAWEIANRNEMLIRDIPLSERVR